LRARLQTIRNGKIRQDRIWKDKKAFVQMSTRGCAVDKVRLDIEIESAADLVVLIDWCNMAHLSFKK